MIFIDQPHFYKNLWQKLIKLKGHVNTDVELAFNGSHNPRDFFVYTKLESPLVDNVFNSPFNLC